MEKLNLLTPTVQRELIDFTQNLVRIKSVTGMRIYTLIISIHQIVFQGMFFAKNILLRPRLGMAVR